jgi:hypothetical protein
VNPTLANLAAWASWIAAAAAVVIYFAVLARRPEWVRLLNGSSLFLTGIALALLARTLPRAAEIASMNVMILAAAMLIVAVAVQSAAALRNRRAWDGVDRRQANDSHAEGEAP